jgi:hypothetical protein
MFIALLGTTLLLAIVVCFILTLFFRKLLDRILHRLIGEEISVAWSRYLLFALYVVGISGGVRVWQLDRYITPQGENKQIIELTNDRWFLEIYQTIIGTLQSVAWMLLVFFMVALVVFVIVKAGEMKRQQKFPESRT